MCGDLARLGVFVLAAVLASGCATGSWPIQSGTDIFRLYPGEERPVNQLAVVDVPPPAQLMKGKRHVSGRFAVLPGSQTLDIYYYARTSYSVSRSTAPVAVPFEAVSGHRYRVFVEDNITESVNGFALPLENVFRARILDTTEPVSLVLLAVLSPSAELAEQAVGLITEPEQLKLVIQQSGAASVRKACMRKLGDPAALSAIVTGADKTDARLDAIGMTADAGALCQVIATPGTDSRLSSAAKSRLAELLGSGDAAVTGSARACVARLKSENKW